MPEDEAVPGEEIELAGRMDKRPRGRLYRQFDSEPEPADDDWAPAEEPDDPTPVGPPPRQRPVGFDPPARPSTPRRPDSAPSELPIQGSRSAWPSDPIDGGAAVPESGARPFLDPRAQRPGQPARSRPGRGTPWARQPAGDEFAADRPQQRGAASAPASQPWPAEAPELVLDEGAAVRSGRPTRQQLPAYRPMTQTGRRFQPRRLGRRRWWPHAILLVAAVGGAVAWLIFGDAHSDLAAVRDELRARVPELSESVGLGGVTPTGLPEASRIPVSLDNKGIDQPTTPRDNVTTRFWDQAAEPAKPVDPLADSSVASPIPIPLPPPPKPERGSFLDGPTRSVTGPALKSEDPASEQPSVLARIWTYVDRLTAAAGFGERDERGS